MPLFSSSSVKDKEGSAHHNKLGKSPHARSASLTGWAGRKGSIGQKSRLDEDASTKAMAGSQSRLQYDDPTGAENVKPLTPKSLNGDQLELNDNPPPVPSHDMGYARATHDMHNDDTRRDSIRTTSTTTWRGNPDAVAMRNRAVYNDTDNGGTAPGMADSGGDFANPGESHVLSGNKAMDLATARQRVQFAIDAELAADRALEIARRAVDEARMMVGALEKQANEEFERAHTKRMETAGVVKELEKLGRHNH